MIKHILAIAITTFAAACAIAPVESEPVSTDDPAAPATEASVGEAEQEVAGDSCQSCNDVLIEGDTMQPPCSTASLTKHQNLYKCGCSGGLANPCMKVCAQAGFCYGKPLPASGACTSCLASRCGSYLNACRADL